MSTWLLWITVVFQWITLIVVASRVSKIRDQNEFWWQMARAAMQKVSK